MRIRYIVSYDITDDKRLRQVYKTMRGFGDHVQYSVFRCDLSLRERAELIAALYPILDHRSDQVLVINVGPVEGRAADCIESIGRPYNSPTRTVVIIE